MGVSETILAAMIGAGATLFTAVFNLVSAFRKSSGDRRTARSSFRSLMWMLALMLAAGVGGFAYAEFRAQQSRDEDRTLRVELQQQMQALAQSTARLEQLRLPAPGAAGAVTESAATVNLPACKGAQVGFATQRGPCTEQDALQVTVCAPVPAAAHITAVELFARSEDSPQPWAESRVAAGQETAGGRFTAAHFERPDGEGSKLVCQSFAHWNSQKGRAVRILVRFGA